MQEFDQEKSKKSVELLNSIMEFELAGVCGTLYSLFLNGDRT